MAEFNAMDATSAAASLRACAAIESFVSTLVEGRPYPDAAALLCRAEEEASGWTATDVDSALQDHPRIGERHVRDGESAAMSALEQAGVSTHADVLQRLAERNRRYEERFGRIFLVRAKGRSTEELLDLLEQRLVNDDATEAAVVQRELAEIVLLRLATLFEEALMSRTLSVHVLDAERGTAATGMDLEVAFADGSRWAGTTDGGGRARTGGAVPAGVHVLTFATGRWFDGQGRFAFYPSVSVTFQANADEHYHVALLLSPFAYTTYRGT